MISKPIRIAILSMYFESQHRGLRAIQAVIDKENEKLESQVYQYEVFETRHLNQHPKAADFDVFISSGGPGDPFDGLGSEWEQNYFQLLDEIQQNNGLKTGSKKFIFSICHSFQLMCRYFEIATVSKRKRPSFGVFYSHLTQHGQTDSLFDGLDDPFYIFDNRSWQCTEPRLERMNALGATLLSVEKYRPNVPYEQAMMSIRISPYWVGTQFHPEANPNEMQIYYAQKERQEAAISQFGEDQFYDMMEHLDHPDYILRTNQLMLPNFLSDAISILNSKNLQS